MERSKFNPPPPIQVPPLSNLPILANPRTPLLVQRIKTPFEITRPRPDTAAHIRVIAVDGLDRHAVKVLRDALKSDIDQLGKQRPVIAYLEEPMWDPRIYPIERWDGFWKAISERAYDPCQEHVIIVDFAPLMAMQRASAQYPDADVYAEQGNWESLANVWGGRIWPDITIIVQQHVDHSRFIPVEEVKTLMIPQAGVQDEVFEQTPLADLLTYTRRWLDV